MNHPATESNYEPLEELKVRYELFKKENPKMRARDIANHLQVSEAQLLACRVGDGVTRLSDDMAEILQSLEPLGELMALTRNDDCVHERKGPYLGAKFFNHGNMNQGLFVNPDIDLRLFMDHWKFAFSVLEGDRKSLQFFDKSGTAIHKIYLTTNSDGKAFDQLVEKFTASTQSDVIEVEEYAPKKPDPNDSEIDWAEFRKAWEGLKDTHEFFGMLRKFKAGRVQAFKKIGTDFAYQVGNDAARKTLQLASDNACEIMVFVGNRGCIQIHTGKVKKLLEHGPWYNVLDPMFNLHLREDKIASSWVTKKPTTDGIVTALELFDEEGEIIATLFGKRKPGIPELTLWRDTISQIKPL